MTGFGCSSKSFFSNENPLECSQGVLQGSSSAAPIYTMNSDVSLSAYSKLGTGASFIHPITHTTYTDIASQYADDKTQFTNLLAATSSWEEVDPSTPCQYEILHQAAAKKLSGLGTPFVDIRR